MSLSWKFEWIGSIEGLHPIIELAKRETYIALDTETVGWQTGNERLCLIQVGLPSIKVAYLVDPLAISDLKIFEEILSTPTPLVVAHNAPFEERQFARYGIKIRGVRDTLSMARTLRSDLPNHTLQTCCSLLLNLPISKVEQTSDWSTRPLTAEQLKYAAMDVEVACALYDLLAEMEARLQLDPALEVPQLMSMLTETVHERYRLTQAVAPELAFLNNRYEMLYEAIRNKLIEGASPYEGEYGRCSIQKISKTQINPMKVRDLFPEIADKAIRETVERKDLTALMKEYGIDPKRIDEVSELLKHEYRLSLQPGNKG